jgi:poly(3-hydroxybutyrate) depolymerase
MLLAVALSAFLAASADLPRGEIIPRVACAEDASQTYALYIPSNYDGAREWPVIFAFDPSGRGQNPVDRYRDAAEKYGYIVAGSNNSRNGPWAVSQAAVSAMTRDVTTRLNINEKREYVAGMSGGSRVALGVALSSSQIAGVIASSAGYPDNRLRNELPFPVFETAGAEDFNYLEMRDMAQALKTPHHLAIFEGPHEWLSSALAMQAIQWMEIQAMKSGRKPRDQAEADEIYKLRVASVPADQTPEAYDAAKEIVDDFSGLEDVSEFSARVAAMDSDKRFRKTLADAEKQDADAEVHERAMTEVVLGEETLLGDRSRRADVLKQLAARWKSLSDIAKSPDDTPQRRVARRVLSGLAMNVTTQDPDYQTIVQQYRLARPGR